LPNVPGDIPARRIFGSPRPEPAAIGWFIPNSWRAEQGFPKTVAGSTRNRIVLEDRMIRKLSSGEYRLYSRKVNPKTGKRRNLGTFKSRAAAEKHERDVQYFKRH
jgi:hypothetical protein